MFGSKTRRQPRGVRPPPRGAASGDEGTRKEASSAAAPEEKPSPATLLRKRQDCSRVVPSAYLLKYFHHAAPAQLFPYFMYPLERPTIPVTDLPTLPRLRMPSLLACTQQRVPVPPTSSSPREPRQRARWSGSEDPLRQLRASLRRSTTRTPPVWNPAREEVRAPSRE